MPHRKHWLAKYPKRREKTLRAFLRLSRISRLKQIGKPRHIRKTTSYSESYVIFGKIRHIRKVGISIKLFSCYVLSMNQNRMCQTFADHSPQFSIRQFISRSLKATNIIAWGAARLCERNPRLQPPKNPSPKATNKICFGTRMECGEVKKRKSEKVIKLHPTTFSPFTFQFFTFYCSSPSATEMIGIRIAGFRSEASLRPTLYFLSPPATRNN